MTNYIFYQFGFLYYLGCNTNQWKTIDSDSIYQFSVSILSVRDTEKRSYERLAPPCYLSQIVEIRFFRKFQGTNKSRTEPFSRRGVLSKIAFLPKMSVRDTNIFTSLMKTRAWFEIPGVWCGSISMRLKSVIENIRRVQAL